MAGTRNVKTSNFKRFEVGEDVQIERGKNKGTMGTCVGFDDETGKVEIELANGNTIFAANGTVNWVRNEFYDPSEFDVELENGEDDEPIEFAGRTFTQEEAEELVSEMADGPLPEKETPKAVAPRKEPKPCQCGCGDLANKGRMFLPGHDQRLKGILIRDMQAGSEEAEAELRKRRWRTESEILQLKAKGSNSGEVTAEAFDAAMALLAD